MSLPDAHIAERDTDAVTVETKDHSGRTIRHVFSRNGFVVAPRETVMIDGTKTRSLGKTFTPNVREVLADAGFRVTMKSVINHMSREGLPA